MINTVLFDLGNVILPFDVTRLARRLAAYSPFSAAEIVDKLWHDELADEFETGRMTPAGYFAYVSDVCRFKNLSFEEFIPIFNDIFDEDSAMTDLVTRLKPNYNLGLISNTNAIHAAHIVTKFPILAHFERMWFSNEAGVRKPEAAIYKMALDHFTAGPAQTVFIDDLPANIAGAKRMGMHGIHYQNVPQLRTDLQTLGVAC